MVLGLTIKSLLSTAGKYAPKNPCPFPPYLEVMAISTWHHCSPSHHHVHTRVLCIRATPYCPKSFVVKQKQEIIWQHDLFPSHIPSWLVITSNPIPRSFTCHPFVTDSRVPLKAGPCTARSYISARLKVEHMPERRDEAKVGGLESMSKLMISACICSPSSLFNGTWTISLMLLV